MGIKLQVTGFCSLSGSKDLSAADKARLLGRTVSLTVNGVPVTGTLVESKSGGLTARFAVKCETSTLGVGTPKASKGPSALEALAQYSASLAPASDEAEDDEPASPELGL